jgi:hypothetical protein
MGSAEKCGVFSAILQGWNDDSVMGKAILDVCDYHVAKLGKQDCEFEPYPYNIFPVELLALRAVRSKERLGTPDVAHPLLNSPLYADFHAGPLEYDDLLRIVLVELRQA